MQFITKYSLRRHIAALLIGCLIVLLIAAAPMPQLLLFLFSASFALPVLIALSAFAGPVAGVSVSILFLSLSLRLVGLNVTSLIALYILPGLAAYQLLSFSKKPLRAVIFGVFASYICSLIMLLLIAKTSFDGGLIEGLSKQLLAFSAKNDGFYLYLVILARAGLLGNIPISESELIYGLSLTTRLALYNGFKLALPALLIRFISFFACSYSLQMSVLSCLFADRFYPPSLKEDGIHKDGLIIPRPRPWLLLIALTGLLMQNMEEVLLANIGGMLYLVIFTLYLIYGLLAFRLTLKLSVRSRLVRWLILIFSYALFDMFLAMYGVLNSSLLRRKNQ